MALTPHTDDPNRDKELKRRKKTPEAFGVSKVQDLPKDWKPAILPAAKKDAENTKKAEAKLAAEEKQKAAEADEAMVALIASVPDMSDEDLEKHSNTLNQELFDAVATEIKKREENNKE